MSKVKSIDSLMKYLRDTHGIHISGVKADYFFPKIAGLKFPRRTLLILLFFLLDPLFP